MRVFSNRLLLITRPLVESMSFSEEIKKLNGSVSTVCCPLFEIENFIIRKDFSRISKAIVTSSNAIRSLAKSEVRFDGTMFCVGNSTAILAKNFGYNSISSDGNSHTLFELIKNSVSPSTERLIYFRGEEITRDISASLGKLNYNVEEVICYRKLPRKLSTKTLNEVGTGLISGATFFSKQTVSLFFKQVNYVPDGFVAFCISEDVSQKISVDYPQFRLVTRVAKEPSMKEMCKLVVAASGFAT